MELFKEVVIHAGEESLKILPFLFIAFLLIEIIEHYAGDREARKMAGMKKTGPVIGALAGCIPQCGFSVVAANFYAERVISRGTLLAVFIATSDEALIIILGNPGHAGAVLLLLAVKLVIAIIAGYVIDWSFPGNESLHEPVSTENTCSHCCASPAGIVITALGHTVKIFVFLFIFAVLINFAIHSLGEEALAKLLLNDTVFQPFIAAAVGLIPNCVPSVLLTQLYLEGMLSFSSLISGLCTGAGLGLLVLLRANKDRVENIKIVILLYFIAVGSGLAMAFFGI